jgi:allophanate hydrolase
MQMRTGTLPLGVRALGEALRRGDLTVHDVVDEVLGRIADRGDDAVWISLAERAALHERAAALEAARADGELPPLFGVPFAVKDNIDVAGLPTTAACPAFAYTPSIDAGSVRRLLDAGAVVIGKTNLDQFATGLVGVRSPYPAAPARAARWPSRRGSSRSRWAPTPQAPDGSPPP